MLKSYPDIRQRPNRYGVLVSPWSQSFQIGIRVYRLDLKPGYTTDGASIPRLLWPICGCPHDAPRNIAALVHDWLYAAQVTDRRTADRIYLETLVSVGFPYHRALAEYYALRCFGWIAWHRVTAQDRSFALDRGMLRRIS